MAVKPVAGRGCQRVQCAEGVPWTALLTIAGRSSGPPCPRGAWPAALAVQMKGKVLSHEPHCQCSAPTGGEWIPYWEAHVWNISATTGKGHHGGQSEADSKFMVLVFDSSGPAGRARHGKLKM